MGRGWTAAPSGLSETKAGGPPAMAPGQGRHSIANRSRRSDTVSRRYARRWSVAKETPLLKAGTVWALLEGSILGSVRAIASPDRSMPIGMRAYRSICGCPGDIVAPDIYRALVPGESTAPRACTKGSPAAGRAVVDECIGNLLDVRPPKSSALPGEATRRRSGLRP